MGSVVTIDDICISKLNKIKVKNGDVFHGIKNSDLGFKNFGELYFSYIDFNAIKAWKMHKKMTMNLIMPVGNSLFVFMDQSGNFRKEKIGVNNYVRITVPPNIWFGFKGLSKSLNLLINLSDIIHSKKEVMNKKIIEIDYHW